MSPAKPTDFPLLLQVFCVGVRSGVISRNEVVSWADKIIADEAEPDYFFIEVSLCRDTNELVSILNAHDPVVEDIIAVRALFGIVCEKLLNEKITLQNAINVVDKFEHHKVLTDFESNYIYSLDFFMYDDPNSVEMLMNDTKVFLSYYKDFNLQNCDQWLTINSEVEQILEIEQAKAEAANEAWQKKWKKQQAKRKFIRSIPFGILLLLAFVIIVVDIIVANTGTIHPMRIWYMNIFGIYFIARWCYPYWKQRK